MRIKILLTLSAITLLWYGKHYRKDCKSHYEKNIHPKIISLYDCGTYCHNCRYLCVADSHMQL